MGGLAVLNVGSGDTKLSFDRKKPAERERCARIVEDMLKRGYAILVEVGKRKGKPLYQSATGFDPKTCEYLIVGLPQEEEGEIARIVDVPQDLERGRTPLIKRGRPPVTRKDATTTNAVAISRSAGG